MQMRTLIGLLLTIGLAAASAEAANFVWLEAERFDNYGGWTNDCQFIDQMGSPYLMAIGLGEPVGDAATCFTPPHPGRYRLWVRTNDWAPKHHPGRFRIVLKGQPIDHVFGQGGRSGWQWEDGV